MTNGEYKLVKDVLWYKQGTIFDIQDDKVFEIAPGGIRIETGDALVNAFVKYFDEDGMEEWVSKLPSVSKSHPRKSKTKACVHKWHLETSWTERFINKESADNDGKIGRRILIFICLKCASAKRVES